MQIYMGLTSGFKLTGSYLQGKQFEGDGITGVLYQEPKMCGKDEGVNEGFGFKEGEYKDMALRIYLGVDGEDRYFDTTSVRLIAAIDAFKVGDVVKMVRRGSQMKTEWTVTKEKPSAEKLAK